MSQTVPSVKTLIFHNLRSDKSSDPIYWHKAYDLRYSRANDFPTSPREPISYVREAHPPEVRHFP